MMNLNQAETVFLNKVKPFLKEGVDDVAIINALREVERDAENRGINKGRNGYQVDNIWHDDQL